MTVSSSFVTLSLFQAFSAAALATFLGYFFQNQSKVGGVHGGEIE
jgi:hypothetical protein